MTNHADMRESLLATALDIFSEKGFSGTSIRDIAKVHGVSLSNIYYHFGNKEGLWREILKHSVQELPSILRQAEQSETAPRAQLEAVVRAHLQEAVAHQRELLMLLVQEAQLEEGIGHDTVEIQREILDIYSGVLERLSAEGALHSKYVKITVFNILGVINWYLRWYRADGPLDLETIHQEVLGFVLHGACREA
ncbi:TetR/AcrR family transcriptional regulator [Antarcticimicrobium sediminis]|uniref:TetR/AcrR family transcriptional regulator n=1 Tax=Antarcticimicrobium sediminis TaxID=2546227 RepID=A0A4R5ENJ7_9RHOB|nr:TetR family transcriptional regulator [Antarcticimicrobium sediminis]TDE36301.1 TetR/AcrR family transcriptional regulator [Antarcticimicrobium sediminis]